MNINANAIFAKIFDGALLTVGGIIVVIALRKFLPGTI